MNISWPPVTGVLSQVTTDKQSPVSEGLESFGDIFKNALQEVSELEQQSSAAKMQLLSGEVDDVHNVLIASEKANVALQLTLQVRNKILDAYHEIMRMQI